MVALTNAINWSQKRNADETKLIKMMRNTIVTPTPREDDEPTSYTGNRLYPFYPDSNGECK